MSYSNILVHTSLCATSLISGKYLIVGLNFSCISHKKKNERLAASLPNERAARAAIPETIVHYRLSIQKGPPAVKSNYLSEVAQSSLPGTPRA